MTLSAPVEGGFMLPVTVGGNLATAGVDYVVPPAELMFAGIAGEVQTVVVSILGDAVVEDDETFVVAPGAPDGLPAEVLSRLTIVTPFVIGTILNDDTASVTLSGPTTVVEPGGGGGTVVVTYTATLTAAVDGGLNVGYAVVPGTATAGSDFTAATGTLAFDGTAGQRLTFEVTILGDGTFEPTETLTIGLTPPTGLPPTIAGGDHAAPLRRWTLSITDDDSAIVGFAGPNSLVAETAGTHIVDVVLRTTGGAVLHTPARFGRSNSARRDRHDRRFHTRHAHSDVPGRFPRRRCRDGAVDVGSGTICWNKRRP